MTNQAHNLVLTPKQSDETEAAYQARIRAFLAQQKALEERQLAIRKAYGRDRD